MKIIRFSLTGLALIIAFPACTAWGQSKPDVATVHLKIVDTFSGDDLGAATVQSFKQEDEAEPKDFADKFQKNTASGIPYGVYRLRAHATGFFSAEKDVYVSQPETNILLGLRFGTIDFSYPVFKVTGKIRNARSIDSKIRMRLIGAFSDLSLDTKPDGSGEFNFAGVPQSTYILVTIVGNEIVDARPLQVPGASPPVIDLGAKVTGPH